MRAAVHIDSARLSDRFVLYDDHIRPLQELDRKETAPVHEHHRRPRIALAGRDRTGDSGAIPPRPIR